MKHELKLAFAEVLAAARIKAGLSKQELADHSNISVTFVKKLENGGAMPSLETIWKLSGPLNLNLATIGECIETCLQSHKGTKIS